MSDEIQAGNAEPAQNTAIQSNMSPAQFITRRLGQNTNDPLVEAKEEVVTNQEEVQEEVQEVSSETEVAEQTEELQSSDDVLSQLDLDDMSESDLRELSEKLGSRAVARFGELTAKRKAAETRLQELESELNRKNPLENTQEVANNPYDSVDSLQGLQEKAQEVNQVIEWAEEVLFNSDGYSADDIVTEVEGRELTKADVRKSLLNGRKARDKFLPAQLENLKKVEHSKQLKTAFDQKAKEELKWLDGEDNDIRNRYEAMVSDTRFSKLNESADPELRAQLNYLIAHAANSIYGRTPIKGNSSSPTLNPSNLGASGSSISEKPVGKSAKALKDLGQRFRQSGNKKDFITLRTLQIKNR